MALSEQLRRGYNRVREQWPFKHQEPDPGEKARKAITFTVQSIQRGKLDAARLMREVDGEDMAIVFTTPEVRLPKIAAYGLLDLNGRMASYHSAPVKLASNLQVFTHPSVLPESANVVFEAVEEHNPNGKRKFVDVWVKRR